MSSTVNQFTLSVIRTNTYETLSTTLGISVLLLLVILLVLKEFMRIHQNQEIKTWMQFMDVAIFPLLVAFGLVILVRFINP